MPDRRIVWFRTIDSTMREAARLAADGCASGTVVGADEQLEGQGRHGRRWHSPAGEGLYVSIVLRLGIASQDLPALTLALGLAAAEAITAETGVACDLRWPNDVLLSGRKCAGVLVQLQEGAAIAGIGINLSQTAFPPEISAIATSLRIETGRVPSRDRLLANLLAAVDNYVRLLETEGKDPILRLFAHASSFVSGRRVIVEQPGGPVRGVTDGLDSTGFLFLRQDNGERTLVLAGGVRPADG